MAASAPGNEGFSIDLFSNSLHDPVAVFRPSSLSIVRVDHDSAGMLAVHLPPNSCRALHFGFLGGHLGNIPKEPSKTKTHGPDELPSKEIKKPLSDNECVKETHSVLREGHQAIFDEQVGCSFSL